jgi:signal transduction histidine kinase
LIVPRTQEQWYREILDALPIAILVLNGDLNVVMANKRVSTLLTLPSRGDGLGIQQIIPHDGLLKQLCEVQQHGGTREVELHLLPPQGFFKGITAVKAWAVRIHPGETAGPWVVLLLEDLSERIRLEQQLIQSEKLAGMGQLAASLAHELGNPLRIMSATLQYLYQRLQQHDDALADNMAVILDNLQRMDELLKTLAGFMGPERPHIECLNLHQTLSHVLTFVAKEAEGHQVTIHMDFEPMLCPCKANHRQLKQVFLNRIKNVLEAMPAGGHLTVSVRRLISAASTAKTELLIAVRDTGIGIADTDLDVIFRPFYSTKKQGTGLGLPFCRWVIEEHGGEIWVHSQHGKGTAVTIRLPVTPEGEDDGPA